MSKGTISDTGRGIVATVALLVTAGCGGVRGEQAPVEPAPPTGTTTIDVSQQDAAPGATVTVRATGFAPNSTVDVGFGPPQSEYDVITQAMTDARGSVIVDIEVPSWAESGRSYVWVVADTDASPKAVSDTFRVTAGETPPGEGVLRLEGVLTDEGVECPAMRDDDGKLYTLAAADLGTLRPGDRLRVTGTVAEVSICMQGTTLSVRSIERAR